MKLPILATAVLTTALSFVTPTITNAANPPARTYQPGYWQPVARVKNPNEPIQIKLVNQTGLPLQYGLTSGKGGIGELPIGGSAVISNTSVPDYLLVNALQQRVKLRDDIAVDGNVVTVQIYQVEAGASDITLNFDESGAVYVY
ncbi:MAG: hypothetical protein KME30_11215 [Iphinoe sp. HA4291-MV1]|jgi:serine/threonine-protein kinase|nr:hypothetical protein [Iphinoe sp. HA4291-MV1]